MFKGDRFCCRFCRSCGVLYSCYQVVKCPGIELNIREQVPISSCHANLVVYQVGMRPLFGL